MTRRQSVPPMRPRDTLLTPTEAPEVETPKVKTNVYLRQDQTDMVDQLRMEHRQAGRRLVTGATLVRAALDLAASQPEAWARAVDEDLAREARR